MFTAGQNIVLGDVKMLTFKNDRNRYLSFITFFCEKHEYHFNGNKVMK